MIAQTLFSRFIRVTAKDAQGNVYSSPDHTLTIDNAIAPATVGSIKVNPDAADTSVQREAAGLVASSRIDYGPDAIYGSTRNANAFDGNPTGFYLDLFNLTSGATYHYLSAIIRKRSFLNMGPAASNILRAEGAIIRPIIHDEAVLLQQVCLDRQCHPVFFICPHCDRGHRYCSAECGAQARLEQRRRANRRHQQSREGRRNFG